MIIDSIRKALAIWQAVRRTRLLTRIETQRHLTKLERIQMAEDMATIKGQPYGSGRADSPRTK